jgi:hypothetical protein
MRSARRYPRKRMPWAPLSLCIQPGCRARQQRGLGAKFDRLKSLEIERAARYSVSTSEREIRATTPTPFGFAAEARA